MAIRTAVQIATGVLAGAVLVGVPTWAMASEDGGVSSTRTDRSQMMSGRQSQDQMMKSMSTMMKDPAVRKGMASMMSQAKGQMPGMGADGSNKGMSGMGRMQDEDGAGKSPSGALKP